MAHPLDEYRTIDAMKPFFETRDPEILQEIKELKARIKGRSYTQDFDRLTDDLELKLFNQTGWPAPYGICNYLIQEAYYERNQLEPLADIYKEHHWPVSGYIHTFTDYVLKQKRPDLVERVWCGVAQKSKAKFLLCLPDRELYSDIEDVTKGVEESKQSAIAAYDNLAAFYKDQNRKEDAAKVEIERETIRNEDFKKPLDKPIALNMDEEEFWKLINTSRRKSNSDAELLLEVTNRLEILRAADIKKFNSIYAKIMKRLYHWEVWALAYAALGGCSDDAFRDFRGWLIMQGEPKLIELAISEPHKAAKQIREYPDLLEGGLLHSISAAYLARAGKILPAVQTDLANPKGKEWDEEALDVSHPELVAYYGQIAGA